MRSNRLDWISHILMVLSSLPETPNRQSGLNSADRTQFMCPLSVNINRWDGSAQTFTVLSSDDDISMRPFEEKFTLLTVPECAAIAVDLPSLHDPHPSDFSSRYSDLLICRTATLLPYTKRSQETIMHCNLPWQQILQCNQTISALHIGKQ